MSNNYDPVARYYDFLSWLVFGQAEINAQIEMLGYVAPGSRMLIVGGGTGWILEKIAAAHSSGLHITYVESSLRMMELSRKRNCGHNSVEFVLLPIEEFVAPAPFDCILTGFVFDNFSADKARAVVRQLDLLLREGGHWLYADFYLPKQKRKLWKAVLLKAMYIAARVICKVEASKLPDMGEIFGEAGYETVYTSWHYSRFIQSVVYRRAAGIIFA
jgi:ubiquinone/menaquinone biosynthesis C-methylase UbiE